MNKEATKPFRLLVGYITIARPAHPVVSGQIYIPPKYDNTCNIFHIKPNIRCWRLLLAAAASWLSSIITNNRTTLMTLHNTSDSLTTTAAVLICATCTAANGQTTVFCFSDTPFAFASVFLLLFVHLLLAPLGRSFNNTTHEKWWRQGKIIAHNKVRNYNRFQEINLLLSSSGRTGWAAIITLRKCNPLSEATNFHLGDTPDQTKQSPRKVFLSCCEVAS